MKGLLISSIIFMLLLTWGASQASGPFGTTSGHGGQPEPLSHKAPPAYHGPLHKKFKRHTSTGNRHFENHDYDRAIGEYYIALKYHEKMLKKCRKKRERCGDEAGFKGRGLATHLLIGRTLAALGDYDGALTNFDVVIHLDDGDYRGYYERARVYAILGDRTSAISDYNMLIELDPDDSSHYIKRAYLFLESGSYGRAIEDYTMVIEIDPGETRAYSGRGDLYFKHFGNRRRACDDWRVSCNLGECTNYDRAKSEGICD